MTLFAAGDRRHIAFEPEPAPHSFRAELSPSLVYFEGHFEERPILPAVAQLSRIVLPLARREYPDLGPVCGLWRVRFRRPIAPRTTITIALSRALLRVSFEIKVGGDVAANGAIDFHPAPPAGGSG